MRGCAIPDTLTEMSNSTGPELLDRQFNFDQKLKASFNNFLGSAYAFKTNAVFLPVEGEVHIFKPSVSHFVLCRLCAQFLQHIAIPDSFVHTASKFAISSVLRDLPLRSFKVFVHRQESFGRTILSLAIVIVDADTLDEAQRVAFRDSDLPKNLPIALSRWLQIPYKVKIDLVDIVTRYDAYQDGPDTHTCPATLKVRALDETTGEEREDHEKAEGRMTLELTEKDGGDTSNVEDVARKSLAQSLDIDPSRVNVISRRRLSEGRQLAASANVKYDLQFEVVMDTIADAETVASVVNDDEFTRVLSTAVSNNLPDNTEVKGIAELTSSNKVMASTMVVL